MKEFFTAYEQQLLNQSHHGGLKFILFKGNEKIKTCYRVMVSGGLDYCNNLVDQIAANDQELFTVRIYDRSGAHSRDWWEIGYLQRTKSTSFNH